jgi:hypothetical protein
MRWIRAGVIGLVFATIALVAVSAVQTALGLASVFTEQSRSGTGGLGAVTAAVTGPALVAAVAGFLIGFLYWLRGPGK